MTPAPLTLRVYLDEDVDVLLAPLLAARGIDCLPAVAAGNLGQSDTAQLTFALQESRIIVTHNRQDYEDLAVAWWGQKRDHAGIILAIRRSDVYELLRHILPVLQLFDQSGWRNSVIYA